MADGTNQVIPDEIRAPFVNEQRKLIEPWASWLRRTWQQAKAAITGSGTAGSLAVFTDTTVIGNGNLSGDASTSGGTVVTLANSGVVAATYGDATHVSQVTVDAKGRVTTAADVAISASVSPPGGANTDIQYNDAGAFGGDANLTWDKTNRTETLTGKDTESTLLIKVSGQPTENLGGNEQGLSLGTHETGGQEIAEIANIGYFAFDPSGEGKMGISLGETPGSPTTYANYTEWDVTERTAELTGDPGVGAIPGLAIGAQRNQSGSGAASTVFGEQRGGTRWFIWQDATGAMRFGPDRPTEDNSISDTSGTLFATGSGSGAGLPTIAAAVSLRL